MLIKGKASHRERIATDEENPVVEVEILAESVTPVKNGSSAENGNGARSVHIRIDGESCPNLEILKSLIESHPGESPVYLHVCRCGTRHRIATAYKVNASPRFVAEVESLLGRDVVRLG